jgi:hypothetical protein
MTRHVLIFYDDFERQYRESLAYLHSKYHDQPTWMKDIPLGDETLYNTNVPQHRNQHRNQTPTGKTVI